MQVYDVCRVGSYDTMTVGLAKNLEGDIYVEGKTYFKPTATVVDDEGKFTSEEVGSGPATIETIQGNTVVWNQIGNANMATFSNGTISSKTYSTIIASAPAGSAQKALQVGGQYTLDNHFYFLSFEYISNLPYKVQDMRAGEIPMDAQTEYTYYCDYGKRAGSAYPTTYWYLYATTTETWNISIRNYMVIDVTLMFGYGNEPANVNDLLEYLNKNVGLAPYYAYNAGTLINAKPSGMASIGYNLMELDGSTGTARVPGKYDDGLYGSYYGIRGSYSGVSFVPAATGISESITPDADGKFEITVPGEIVVSGAGSSTTVFMWYDGSYIEDSIEYEKNEYGGLDVTKIYGKANGSSTYTQVFPDGLMAISDTRDALDLKNGTATRSISSWLVNGTAGHTFSWYADGNNAYTTISGRKKSTPMISTVYPFGGYYFSTVSYQRDKSIGSYSGDSFAEICIKDSTNITSAETMYSYFTNHPFTIYFILEAPITYTDLIVSNDGGETGTPVQVFNYTVDNWGLEELLPQNDYVATNGMATTAPILNVRYSIDAVEAINTLNDEVADLYETKANTEGYYPELSVGLADNLKGQSDVTEAFLERTTGGDAEIANGTASLLKVEGNTVKESGVISNVTMTGLSSTGFNLLNPQTHTAYVIGEYTEDYDNLYAITGTYSTITFTPTGGSATSITPDTENDNTFEILEPGTITVTGDDDTTCIYLYWDGSKTESEPYVDPSIARLDVTKIKGTPGGSSSESEVIFENGMNGIGDVRDEISESGAVKRIGVRAYTSGDTDSSTMITDGTTTYYVLDEPVVYTSLQYDNSEYFNNGMAVVLPINYTVNNWGFEFILDSDAAPYVTCSYATDVLETINTINDEIDNLKEEKANAKGAYPNMTVGNLISDASIPRQFYYSKTAGEGTEIGSGYTTVNDIKGNTIVWNQSFSCGSGTVNGVIRTTTNSYTFTYSGTSSASDSNTLKRVSVISGHKYLLRVIGNATGINFVCMTGFSAVANEIKLCTSSSDSCDIRQIYSVGNEVSGTVSIGFYDLTQMFGSGKEIGSVSEFNKMFPSDYYPLDNGTLISLNPTSVVSTGFNLWDEQWESGRLDNNGQKVPSGSQIRSKNYIPVLPATKYFFRCPNNTDLAWVCCYDSNKEYLGHFIYENYTSGGYPFETLSNTNFILFDCNTTYGTVYKDDMCINLSDTTANGTYKPHIANSSTDLSWIQSITYTPEGSSEPVQLFPNGLCSAGTVYDEVTPTKAIKRVGTKIIDNTYSPHIYELYRGNYYASYAAALFADARPSQSLKTTSQGYESGTVPGSVYLVGGTTQLAYFPRIQTLTTVEQYQTWIANNPLTVNYELAEPIEVPINHTIEYAVQPGGTEQLLPENTLSTTPTTSEIIMDVTYPLDAVGTIQNLPSNYISSESMTAFINAINSANVGFTVTMSYNSETGKYAFTVTQTQQTT